MEEIELRSPSPANVAPLRLSFSTEGKSTLVDALLYLNGIGEGIAEQFNNRLDTALVATCERIAHEIATGGKPSESIYEQASLYYARPAYRLKVETTKARARRSSAGLWYVFYALEDRAKAGQADTLVVLSIRHSAAAPLTIEPRVDDEEQAERLPQRKP